MTEISTHLLTSYKQKKRIALHAFDRRFESLPEQRHIVWLKRSGGGGGGNGGGLGCGMGDTATKGSNDVFFICIRHVGETMQKR